jgi:hypothetical protein
LYCLVRDFHPEVFTYARFIANSTNVPDKFSKLKNNESKFELESFNELDKVEGQMEENGIEQYYWDEETHLFVSEHAEEIKNINEITHQALRYAWIFVEYFPGIKEGSGSLGLFFEELQKNPTIGKFAELTEENKKEAMEAMEKYEHYYSLRIQSQYKTNDTLEANILGFFTDYYVKLKKYIQELDKATPPRAHSSKVDPIQQEPPHGTRKRVRELNEEVSSNKEVSPKKLAKILKLPEVPQIFINQSQEDPHTPPRLGKPRDLQVQGSGNGKFSKLKITRKTRRFSKHPRVSRGHKHNPSNLRRKLKIKN